MTQRDWVKIAGGAVIGLAVAAVLGVGLLGLNLGGDTETDVTISMFDNTCTLGKASHIVVRKDKQLIWDIENYCSDAAKTITVGNFQKGSPSTASDCSQPGRDYPFTDASEQARTATVKAAGKRGDDSIKPADTKLKLKAKGEEALGKYFFDVCLDGTKVDPELLIQR